MTTTDRKGQVVRRTGRNGRDYEWGPTGERFPSVTTLIGGLAKPSIPYWSAGVVAETAYDRHQLLTQYVQDGDRDGAVKWLKGAPWAKSGKAADAGTTIHAHIEAAVLGTPITTPDPAHAPYLDSFDLFVEDHGVQFMMAEAPVFNRAEKYAGTLDAIATFTGGLHEGGPYLIDYKTSSTSLAQLAATGKPGPPYGEVALQLAAYRAAEFVGAPDGTEQPMPATVGGFAVVLFEDGYRLVRVECGPDIFTAFLYAREAYRWTAVTSRHVFTATETVTLKREVAA